jgi:MtN3 and saliva related transmembrane protein
MVDQTQGLHHFEKRKRQHQNLEPYPHPNTLKRFVDKTIIFVGVIGPIMTVPQILKIWVEKNAGSISLISFSTYIFVALFWVYYGILHKEKPIIITHGAWALMHFFIVIGTILYA